MQLSHNFTRKRSHKLNDFINIPLDSSGSKPLPPCKKIHASFHNNPSRIETDVSDKPPRRQKCSASFYDNFQFVDRLTNNKLAYRQARKSSNSLIQFRKAQQPTKTEDKTQMNSLLQIYKKTKNFQMMSLKEKIFKKAQSGKDLTDKTSRNIQDTPNQNQQSKSLKSNSLINIKPATAQQFIESSRKKNRLKSFIDRTVANMNKAELQRIVNSSGPVRQEVMQFTQNLLNLKCTMDQQKIDDLLYLREKQEFEMGRPNEFVQKEKPIVFKDLGNMMNTSERNQESSEKSGPEQLVARVFCKNKRKKLSLAEKKDIFLQKMIIHARNHLKKSGQFLVEPKKEKINRNMLIKKSGKRFIKTLNEDTENDLCAYSFSRKQQSSLVSEVKSLVAKNKKPASSSSMGNLQPSENEKNVMCLLKQNYVSNLGIELVINPSAAYTKDQKGNNLLHMAVRYQRPQMIEMIFKKVPYRVSRNLLMAQNSNKRTPLELAKLVVDVRAVEIIQKFVQENKQRDIVEGWIETTDFK